MSSTRRAVRLFSDLVSRDDEGIRLPAAALAIASVVYEDLDFEHWLAELEMMGLEAQTLARATPERDRLEVLTELYFDRLGFRGNREDYYDPRNSFLNEVLERRTGIPISMALVFIELGSAIGLGVEGVGFPGHFLVRELEQGRLVDVFGGGQVLSVDQCKALLERQGMTGQWRDEFLEGVNSRQMLTRILNNLRRHYADVGESGSEVAEAIDEMIALQTAVEEDQAKSLPIQ